MASAVARAAVSRLASRDPTRREVDVRADVYVLLTCGELALTPGQVARREVGTGVGTRRWLDVEIGHAAIEITADARVRGVVADAEAQLAGYVTAQARRLGTRYVGILTDGARWNLYHLVDGALVRAAELTLDPANPDADGLLAWLEAILSTHDSVPPTPEQVRCRLGASSPAHRLDHAALTALYAKAANHPEVARKRELWSRLLRTAFGKSFTDSETLFVDHTLLVLTAGLIGQAVMGLDVARTISFSPAARGQGTGLTNGHGHGVVEADFADWVRHLDGGPQLVAALAHRAARFDWSRVEHDVLKTLYESVIGQDDRRSLGEYYTPDWLAERMVDAAVTDPLTQRVLDPACGSGTFVFHAVRAYLRAAEKAGMSGGEAAVAVTSHVFGMDIHPVSVTLARVTYLLAIGSKRLQAPERGPLSIPVYLGDSVQWDHRRDLLGDLDRGMGDTTRPLCDTTRPLWLAESEYRVDVLVGNPPWLRYSAMTVSMQARYKSLAGELGLLVGGPLGASSRDLATLFVARAVELYLKPSGRFSFVMPHGTLTRKPADAFRSGRWGGEVTVAFSEAWDLHQAPTGFPMVSCVVNGQKTINAPCRMPAEVMLWSARLASPNVSWSQAQHRFTIEPGRVQALSSTDRPAPSPYKTRFRNGAILYPRLLLFVELAPAGPLGAGAGRVAVQSRRTTTEKPPWKSVASLHGTVEQAFVRAIHLGETLLPFRMLDPQRAVLPVTDRGILTAEQIEDHLDLAAWWGRVEAAWDHTKQPDDISPFLRRIDYHGQLRAQLPAARHRVLYTASGNTLAAARIETPDAIVEHKLYWAATGSRAEARYLTSVLNSSTVLERVTPLQARGLFGTRDFDKNVFAVPIPAFDEANEAHRALVTLAEQAEAVAAQLDLSNESDFKRMRRLVRTALADECLAAAIDEVVAGVFPPS